MHWIRATTTVLWLVAFTTVHAQTASDLIRGRVRSDSGVAIAGALVRITRAPDRAVFQASTDSAGMFAITVLNGTGDYLVHVTAPGWQTFRKRLTRADTGSSTLVVDATLRSSAPPTLATVQVTATKPRPSRSLDPGTATGAAEAMVDDFIGGVPPDQAGNLASMAMTLPGITQAGSGISVLGLDPSQNMASLNGMSLGIGALPRAAATTLRVSTTAYDPKVGWFSGARSNVELGSGSVFTIRNATGTIDTPVLQFSGRGSTGVGGQISGQDASLGGSGPLGNGDLYFYNYGVQAGRRVVAAPWLFMSDPSALQYAGLAQDSVNRLSTSLGRLGVPVSLPSVASAPTTERFSFIARLDRNQLDVQTFRPARRAASLTGFGSWERSSSLSAAVTTAQTRSAQQWYGTLGGQATYSTYYGDDYLATFRSALSLSRQESEPYLRAAAGEVLLTSDLTGGTQQVNTVLFGGGEVPSRSRDWTWENSAETQLYLPRHPSHRLSLSGNVRLDGYGNSSDVDPGTYSFTTLKDVADGRPASFRRTIDTAHVTGGEGNAFIALGDLWRVSPTFRLEYGARIEGSAFTRAALPNQDLARTLGVRTDAAPGHVHVSPRLGFTWVRRGAGNAGALAVNRLGAFNLGPTAYLRGGIGEFRSMLSPSLLRDPMQMNGLPGSARSLMCLGETVGAPQWGETAAETMDPRNRCTGLQTLVDSAPSVRLIDENYAPPRSWRANLSYASHVRGIAWTLDGTYSLNLDQPGIVDVNLRDVPVFTTGDEGRPVFVPTSGIVPSSGAVSPRAARLADTYGSVIIKQSSLRSVSKQMILTVSPDLSRVNTWWASASYILSSTMVLQSGFDGSAFGSPIGRDWERSAVDARHRILVRGGYASRGLTFTALARVRSGLPFTPMVGADVNGDGLANDRAYLVPASATGFPLQRSLSELAAGSSESIRSCLSVDQGTPARAKSCTGPWATTLNAQITIEGSRLPKQGRLSAIHVNFSNPLAGIDRIVHGGDDLRGWGLDEIPEPVLYTVRGFDPASRTFAYAVNPRFGRADRFRSQLASPFRLTVDLSFNLTPDIAQQQLRRYLGPGRGRPGTRLTAPELVRRYARAVTDPFVAILNEADSLLLSRQQVEALREADSRYRQRVDSLWLDLATEFAAYGDEYDVARAVRRQEEALAEARELGRVHVRAILGQVLSPVQLQLMPGFVLEMYRSPVSLIPGGRTLSP